MAGGLDRQIFDDAARPEDDGAQTIPDAGVDQAVSDAIRGMQRTPDQPAAPRARAPSDVDGVDGRSSSGLMQALLDERDKRQEYARQIERYEQERRQWQSRQEQPNLSEALFTDPPGTLERLREEWTRPLEERLVQVQLDTDFKYAHVRYGDEFAQAWQTWHEQVKDGKDANSYFAVMNSGSPGEALVAWYRRVSRDREIGDDLEGYKQRVIEEYLSGQGRSLDRPRAPNGQFTERPQTQRLPTATSRLGASRRDDSEDDDNDGSDAAIFAAARPSRRGQR